MLFKISFTTVPETELYEYRESSHADCYHFVSEDGKTLKLRFLAPDSILFWRKTPEIEVRGTLKKDRVTTIQAFIPQYGMKIPYEVKTLDINGNFPTEISFCYQIIEDGSNAEPPVEVTITKAV